MSLLETKYEPLVQATRQRISADSVLKELNNPSVDPAALLRFLVEYSALSVQMTEPVDSWILRAGERTEALGLPAIGADLKAHAKHEQGHHLMLIEDSKVLSSRWNAKYPAQRVDVQNLLKQAPSPAMQAYIGLHEEIIASNHPFAQVAIELEIEGLAISWAPGFMKNVKAVLGEEVAGELSFLKEHIAIDVGHTAFNRRLMNLLLEARPNDVEIIAEVGRRALNTYLDFVTDCWARTQRVLASGMEQAAAMASAVASTTRVDTAV